MDSVAAADDDDVDYFTVLLLLRCHNGLRDPI